MKGTYIYRGVPPWTKEKRTPAEVVEWRGDWVLLRDLSITAPGKDFLIEADLGNFELDIPPVNPPVVKTWNEQATDGFTFDGEASYE
jgi:hypothetical protein